MKTKNTPASKRLFKKLSALRATLPNDERRILDEMIGVNNEVEAHKMKNKATRKATKTSYQVSGHQMKSKTISKAAGKTQTKAQPQVTAHQMKSKTISKAAGKTQTKAQPQVTAHQMKSKTISKAAGKTQTKAQTQVTAHKMSVSKTTQKQVSKNAPRITFDQTTEEYKISD